MANKKKYTVYHGGWGETKNLIGTGDTPEEANKIVSQYIESIKFKSYYIRTIFDEENLKYVEDYGSHSDFICIVCDSSESFKTFIKPVQL